MAESIKTSSQKDISADEKLHNIDPKVAGTIPINPDSDHNAQSIIKDGVINHNDGNQDIAKSVSPENSQQDLPSKPEQINHEDDIVTFSPDSVSSSDSTAKPVTDDQSAILNKLSAYRPDYNNINFDSSPLSKVWAPLAPSDLSDNLGLIENFNPLNPFPFENVKFGSTTDTSQHIDQIPIIVKTEVASPIAVTDTATTNENMPIIINVQGNDFDPTGDKLTTVIDHQPANGTAVVNNDGSITYTPNSGYVGQDTYSYHLLDPTNGTISNSVTDTVHVQAVTPTAVSDMATTNENMPIIINVQGNDFDPTGDKLTTVIDQQPTHGTAVVNNDGSITYTPNSGYVGQDTYSYHLLDPTNGTISNSVTDSINVQAVAPTAVSDMATVNENGSVIIPVQSNDSDPTNDRLTTVIDQQPTHGTAVVNNDGSITYTPNSGYVGQDTYGYHLLDPTNGTVSNSVTDSIYVEKPIPIAVNDTVTINENSSVIINVQGNDINPTDDKLITVIDKQPTNGTVVVNNDGTVTYTPNHGYVGTDVYVYHLYDPINDTTSYPAYDAVHVKGIAPTAVPDMATTDENTPVIINVQGNDSNPTGDMLTTVIVQQPDNGTAVVNNDGSITYTPDLGYIGPDTYSYHLLDHTNGTVSNKVTDSINVQAVAPTAVTDMTIASENTPVIINVQGNDSNPTGDMLTTVIVQQPANGTTVVNDDGTITYTPNHGYVGQDTYSYYLVDPTNNTISNTVADTVNVQAVAPTAVSDMATIEVNTPVIINVQSNDSDPTGDKLTTVIDQQPANGIAVVNNDSTITYTPNHGYVGQDTYTYHLVDPTNNTISNIVTDTVNVQATAPTAVSDMATTEVNTPVIINVQSNDSGYTGDKLTTVIDQQPANGTVVVNSDGTITYTPNPDYVGTDTYGYHLLDSTNGTISNKVTDTVDVQHFNLVADSYQANVNQDSSIVIDPQNNNTYPTGTVPVIDQQPSHGTVTIGPDGGLTYTPNPGYSGTDSFTYQENDGSVSSNIGTVNINVNPVEYLITGVDQTTNSGGTTLFSLDPTTGTLTELGVAQGEKYNAVGYDPVDNTIYGIDTSNRDINKINLDGTTVDLGLIQNNYEGNTPNVGAFDSNGLYYEGSSLVGTVQVSNEYGQSTQISNPDGTKVGADIAIDPTTNILYTITNDQGSGTSDGFHHIQEYSILNGKITLIKDEATTYAYTGSNNDVGGLLIDGTGQNLYAVLNSNVHNATVEKFNIATGIATFVTNTVIGGGGGVDGTTITHAQSVQDVTVIPATDHTTTVG